MKFGLHFQLLCSADQSPVQRDRDTIEQTAHAESLGFDSVWPVEQHFNPNLSIMPAPLLMLAALAERTRTLRLGHRNRIAAAVASAAHCRGSRDPRCYQQRSRRVRYRPGCGAQSLPGLWRSDCREP